VDRVLEEDDRLVRYGGDEFIVILPRQSKEAALTKVERMREALATTCFLDKEGINVQLSASFGLASFPEDAQDKRELLRKRTGACLRARPGEEQITISGRAEERAEPELELVDAGVG